MVSFATIPTDILLYALGGLVIFLLVWILRLEIRLRRLLAGKNGKSLEDTVLFIKNGQQELEVFRKEVEKYLYGVEKRLKRSVQSVKTIRFNPFKGTGTGGNQSFVTVFLNEDGNGVVFSSLHARDRVSIFSKPVEKLVSPHELTHEEQDAITQAKESLFANQSDQRV